MVHGSRSLAPANDTNRRFGKPFSICRLTQTLIAAIHIQCNQYTLIRRGVGNRVNPRVCVPFSSARPKTLRPYRWGKTVFSLTLRQHRSRRPNLIYLSVFEHVPQAACVAAGLVPFRSALIKAKLGVAFLHICVYSFILGICVSFESSPKNLYETYLATCMSLSACLSFFHTIGIIPDGDIFFTAFL